MSLEALREVVGSPEHRALAADIARRAVTLLRDRDGLVPAADTGRTLVIEYAPETEIKAGRVFRAEFRAPRAGRARAVQVARIGPSVSAQALDSIGRLAGDASTVIVTAYVRRVEGEGRFAVPQSIASWIDEMSTRRRVIVVAFGNPYLIRQFPRVGTYMVTYGVSDDLERAASRAILGLGRITGRSPVSLPGAFRAGDGIQR